MLISFPSRTSCSSAPTPSNTTRTGRSSSRCFFLLFFSGTILNNFLEQDSIVLQSVFTNARERLEQVDDEEEEEELF